MLAAQRIHAGVPAQVGLDREREVLLLGVEMRADLPLEVCEQHHGRTDVRAPSARATLREQRSDRLEVTPQGCVLADDHGIRFLLAGRILDGREVDAQHIDQRAHGRR